MNDVSDGPIQTFEQKFSNSNKILDLKLLKSPNLGADYTTNNLKVVVNYEEIKSLFRAFI